MDGSPAAHWVGSLDDDIAALRAIRPPHGKATEVTVDRDDWADLRDGVAWICKRNAVAPARVRFHAMELELTRSGGRFAA
jgi:hypothetical protein